MPTRPGLAEATRPGLAEATRQGIVRALGGGKLTLDEIADLFAVSLAEVLTIRRSTG